MGHGVLGGGLFPSRQPVVDLLQVAMEGLETGFLQRGISGRIGSVALGPADMGVRGMHAGGEEADQGERLGVGELLFRPQPEPFAEIGQNGGVLGQRLAVVEAQCRHAPLRVDLEIVLRALLAVGEVDLLRLVLLAALFQHDMRRHRARAGSVIQRQHSSPPLHDLRSRSRLNSAQPVFFGAGTGRPPTLRLTEPRWVRLVKYKVFQSSPPKAMLVVAGCPCTMRPSFLPWGSRIQIPPAPPQYTLPATSTFMPSGTPGSLPRRSANTRSLCFASVPLGRTSKARMWPRRVSLT